MTDKQKFNSTIHHRYSNEVKELISEMANTQRVKSRTLKKAKGEGKPTPGE